MAMQDTQGDGQDVFDANPPPSSPGPTPVDDGMHFGNSQWDEIAGYFRSLGVTPTIGLVSAWGSNIDARYMTAIRQHIYQQYGRGGAQDPNRPAATTTPTTPTAPQGGDPEGFRKAWFESGGGNTTQLAQFVKDHPEFGATVTGSKGSKVQFGNGQAFQAVRSAGINGGIGPAWDDLSQANSAPAAQAGFTAPPGSALPDFVAPTGITEENDPGYQARLATGEQGLQRGLSAMGVAHTGGALKDLMQYDQTFASNEFGNVWNRALQDYGTKYGKSTDTYNRAKGEYDTKFGNLFSLAQLDSQNTNSLNNLNLGYAGLFGNINGNGANAYGNYLGQGANANAAGTVGQSNAWNSLFSSIPRSALDAYYASQYGRSPSGAGGSGNALPGTY